MRRANLYTRRTPSFRMHRASTATSAHVQSALRDADLHNYMTHFDYGPLGEAASDPSTPLAHALVALERAARDLRRTASGALPTTTALQRDGFALRRALDAANREREKVLHPERQ
jgi:hypothetical protein